MKPIDIVVIVIVALLSVAAIAYLAVRKIKGKSGCDCGGDCSACGSCKSKDTTCPHCKDVDKP